MGSSYGGFVRLLAGAIHPGEAIAPESTSMAPRTSTALPAPSSPSTRTRARLFAGAIHPGEAIALETSESQAAPCRREEAAPRWRGSLLWLCSGVLWQSTFRTRLDQR